MIGHGPAAIHIQDNDRFKISGNPRRIVQSVIASRVQPAQTVRKYIVLVTAIPPVKRVYSKNTVTIFILPLLKIPPAQGSLGFKEKYSTPRGEILRIVKVTSPVKRS